MPVTPSVSEGPGGVGGATPVRPGPSLTLGVTVAVLCVTGLLIAYPMHVKMGTVRTIHLYVAIVFVLLVIIRGVKPILVAEAIVIATGFAMFAASADIDSPMRLFGFAAPWLGGLQSARVLHHAGMWLLAAFALLYLRRDKAHMSV
jgi:Ni,Fe-hydrogenase I cytochrome b subunit